MTEFECLYCGKTLVKCRAAGRNPKWCSSRCRKLGLYGGTCVDCGARTLGDSGPNSAPDRCSPCSNRHLQLRWTPEAIVTAIREWAEQHGRQPVADDWRYATKSHPAKDTVVRKVGWNAALRLAGFEPVREFTTPMKDGDVTLATVAALYREGESTTRIAARFGVSGTAVRQWLDAAGVPRRSLSEAQRLWRPA